jgi:adenosylhomocysteine nucleosidase
VSVNINLVAAFHAEARPIIEEAGLREISVHGGLRVYQGSNLHLVIGGSGKTATALAVGWLARYTPDSSVWLNFGIAGHASLDLGDAFIAVDIFDKSLGRHWYPPQVIATDLSASVLTTVECPETSYSDAGGFDMEAGAFISCARRFNSAELVQSIKVVSDNPAHPVKKRGSEWVNALISPVGKDILDYSARLAQLAEVLPPPQKALPDDLLTAYHFTTTQRRQLQDMVRKWWSTFGTGPGVFIQQGKFRDSKELLSRLALKLEGTVPVLPRKIPK